MKKLFFLGALLLCTLTASAQFERGVKYVNGSLTGLGFSYSSNEKARFGLDATAGYFVADNLMLRGTFGYDHKKHIDDVQVGAGVRYYFDTCGVYLGGGAEYDHFTKNNNDVMIPVEVGYAFFINKILTLEPAVYYKMSLHDFGGNSTVGIRLGIGIYF